MKGRGKDGREGEGRWRKEGKYGNRIKGRECEKMDDMAKTRREGEGRRWEQEEERLQQKIGGSESRLVGWVIVWEGCKVGYQKRRNLKGRRGREGRRVSNEGEATKCWWGR